jgi:hypothetical protein
MPPWPEVSLPRVHEPIFPSCCIRCRQPEPESTYRAGIFGTEGWLVFLFGGAGVHLRGALAGRCSVDVPACPSCQQALCRQRGWRRLALVVILLAGLGFCTWIFGVSSGDPIERLLWTMAAALLCALPLILWLFFFSPAILVWVYGLGHEMLAFRFRDFEYAEEFAALNETVVERKWF